MSRLETSSPDVTVMRIASSGRCRSFFVNDAITNRLSFGLSRSRILSAMCFLLIPLTKYSSFCIQCRSICSAEGGGSGFIQPASGGGLRKIRLMGRVRRSPHLTSTPVIICQHSVVTQIRSHDMTVPVLVPLRFSIGQMTSASSGSRDMSRVCQYRQCMR